MMQKVEVLKTIPELVCSYFSEEQFTLSGSYYYFTSWKECDMIVGNDNMAVLPNG